MIDFLVFAIMSVLNKGDVYMEREKNKHGLALIGHSVGRLNGKFSQCFVGTFTFVAPLLLVLIGFGILGLCCQNILLFTIGVLLFAMFFGMLDTGYIRYYRAVLNGENPSLGVIFSEVRFTKHALLLVLLSTILIALYIVGTLLFIITVGFVITFLSLMFFVVEHYEITTFRKSFITSATLMVGNRLHMLAYKLLFFLIYGVLIALAVLCGFLVYSMLTNVALAVVFAICGIIVFLFLYSLVTVYYHACNETFFEDAIIHKNVVDERNRKHIEEYRAKMAAKEAPAAETVAQEEPVATETTEEAPAPKKAPAKKTTTAKKSTSTAKKSTAKKTTTTKKATK